MQKRGVPGTNYRPTFRSLRFCMVFRKHLRRLTAACRSSSWKVVLGFSTSHNRDSLRSLPRSDRHSVMSRPNCLSEPVGQLCSCELESVKVFHAGTATLDGDVVTDGGRVLGVTALGEDVSAAKLNAYQAVKAIRWDGSWCRTDISDKARL